MLSFPFPPKNLSLCFSPTLPLFLGHQVGGWGRKRAHERVSERVETKRKTGKSRLRASGGGRDSFAADSGERGSVDRECFEDFFSPRRIPTSQGASVFCKVGPFAAAAVIFTYCISHCLDDNHKKPYFLQSFSAETASASEEETTGARRRGRKTFLLLTRGGGGGETPGKKRGGKEEKTFKSARATVKVGKKEEGEEGNGTPQIRTEILQRAESVHAVEKEEDSTSSHRPATVRFDGVRQGAIGSHYALCST